MAETQQHIYAWNFGHKYFQTHFRTLETQDIKLKD